MAHMSRMPFIVLFAVVMAFMLAGCQSSRKQPERPARISHFVFIKLQNPADAEELIRDCDTMLAPIPGVACYACGKHLDTGRGAGVNSDYDVAAYFGFNSEKDYARYVDHPDHIAGVNKWRPRWQWIRVQDMADPSP